jgi:hypothetical protein
MKDGVEHWIDIKILNIYEIDLSINMEDYIKMRTHEKNSQKLWNERKFLRTKIKTLTIKGDVKED